MDSEYPFSAVDLGDALLWPHTRLDSEIRSRENMLKRIQEKRKELDAAENIVRDELGTLAAMASRRVLCVLSEYPIARTHRPERIEDEVILATLKDARWNRCEAARRLDVTETYVRKRVKEMERKGIDIQESPYIKKGMAAKLRAVK